MDTQIVKLVDHENDLVDFGLKYGPITIEPSGIPPDDKVGYILLVVV